MCLFVTALLPESTHIDGAAEIFEKHKVGFKRISNPSVLEQSAPGDIYILTTHGWCDCSTALGMATRRAVHPPPDPHERVSKLRKQGWSEAKIQRWLEQKEQSEEKRERRLHARAENETPYLDRWLGLIPELLRSGHASRVGLLLHFYNHGSLENDRIEFARQEEVSLTELNAEYLLHMEEDVVYHYIP